MKKYDCIFLDRDGTLNPDSGYINNFSDFNFYSFTIPALKLMSKINKFCIVTNQSGVERGLVSVENLSTVNKFIIKEFSNHKIPLIDILMCYDHPDNASDRRKPGPGMFQEAKTKYNLRLSNCLMVGDSIVDIQAGKDLGMETMLVLTGQGQKTLDIIGNPKMVSYVASNIYEGFKLICQ